MWIRTNKTGDGLGNVVKRDYKSLFNTNFGRDTKALRRSIVKACILNVRIDVFGMLSVPAGAEGECKIPKWLKDSSICDLSHEQVESGCLRQEEKSERGRPEESE